MFPFGQSTVTQDKPLQCLESYPSSVFSGMRTGPRVEAGGKKIEDRKSSKV